MFYIRTFHSHSLQPSARLDLALPTLSSLPQPHLQDELEKLRAAKAEEALRSEAQLKETQDIASEFRADLERSALRCCANKMWT